MRRTALIKSNNPHLAGGEIYIQKKHTRSTEIFAKSQTSSGTPVGFGYFDGCSILQVV